MQYPMTKVFALYHDSRMKPLGIFDTQDLAFQALEWYVANHTLERRGFDVVSMNVHNSLSW